MISRLKFSKFAFNISSAFIWFAFITSTSIFISLSFLLISSSFVSNVFRPLKLRLHLSKQGVCMRGDYRQNERIQLCNCVVSFYCCNMPLYYYVSSSFGNIVFRQYHRCFATPSFGSFVIRHDSRRRILRLEIFSREYTVMINNGGRCRVE